MSEKIINLILRCISISARFFAFIYLLNVVNKSDMAEYIVIQAYVSFLVYFAGLDIYTVVNREYVTGLKDKGSLFLNQTMVYLFTYLVILILNLFYFDNTYLIICVWCMIVGEHICLEIYRYNNITNKQLHASIMFLGRAIFPLVVIYLIDVLKSELNLWNILLCYAICNIFLAIVSGAELARRLGCVVLTSKKIRYTTIKSIIAKCIYFIIGSLCLRFTYYFDKEVVSQFEDASNIIIYGFYFSIFMTILTAGEAYTLSYANAKFRELIVGEPSGKRQIKKWFYELTIISFIGTFGFFIVIKYLPVPQIYKNFDLAIAISLSMFTLVTSYSALLSIPLYYKKRDRFLCMSNITQLIIFLGLCSLCILLSPIGWFSSCIALSLLVAGVVNLFLKYRNYAVLQTEAKGERYGIKY